MAKINDLDVDIYLVPISKEEKQMLRNKIFLKYLFLFTSLTALYLSILTNCHNTEHFLVSSNNIVILELTLKRLSLVGETVKQPMHSKVA